MFGAGTEVSVHVLLTALYLSYILTPAEISDAALEGSSLTIIKIDESFTDF